jgi:hypothetical protein
VVGSQQGQVATSVAIWDRLGVSLRQTGWAKATGAVYGLTAQDTAMVRQAYEELVPDNWLPPGHDYRSRAYQCYAVGPDLCTLTWVADPPPYWQSTAINRLAGGIARNFYVLPVAHPATRIVARLAANFLTVIANAKLCIDNSSGFYLDIHYIRISAPGKPAPEGVHRDGLVAGGVLCVGRENVKGGLTVLYDLARTQLATLRLDREMDTLIFDDRRVLHYTTDISPINPKEIGWRDVILFGVRVRENRLIRS